MPKLNDLQVIFLFALLIRYNKTLFHYFQYQAKHLSLMLRDLNFKLLKEFSESIGHSLKKNALISKKESNSNN